ncbi:MAG: sporulation/spore germination protein [Spirulina sp.]
MQRYQQVFYPIVGTIAIALGGYGVSNAKYFSEPEGKPVTISITPSRDRQTITIPPSPSLPAEITIQTKQAIDPNAVSIQIFSPDRQCLELVPQQVSVPQDRSLETAIAKTLDRVSNGDFSLAGYRVQVNNGIATVDLRLSPESQRHFASLSPCETFSLFGSLRQTLTQNLQWNIRDVRFTEQGQEIYL